MKTLIRFILDIFILVVVAFLLIFSMSKIKRYEQLKTPIEETKEDYSQYEQVIDYGVVDLWQNFNFEVLLSEDKELVLSKESTLLASLGLLKKGRSFYKEGSIEVKADKDIYIECVSRFDDGGMIIYYYEVGCDSIVLYGSTYDYYLVDSSSTQAYINGIGNIEIVKKELTVNGSTFTLESGDYHDIQDKIYGAKIRVKKVKDVYYIRNTALTEQTGTDTYLLHIYNPYTDGDIIFYDKTITAYRFNSEYSIITSDNCFVYEKVLITK